MEKLNQISNQLYVCKTLQRNETFKDMELTMLLTVVKEGEKDGY